MYVFFLVNNHVYISTLQLTRRLAVDPQQTQSRRSIMILQNHNALLTTYYMSGIGLGALCALSHLIS